MGLNFYQMDDETKQYSLFLNSNAVRLSDLAANGQILRTYHDKRIGSAISKRLFLHNDDASKFFTNVIISLDGYTIDTPDEPYYDITMQPVIVKLFKGWLQPNTVKWLGTSEYNSLYYPSIGSKNAPNNRFYPFWIGIEVIADSEYILNDILSTDITLNLSAEETSHGTSVVNNNYTNKKPTADKPGLSGTNLITKPSRSVITATRQKVVEKDGKRKRVRERKYRGI